ncbi:ankyrin repeat-containing domain protein [Lasiosphaeria ovina]|uniref:Ankyrin repeat-containing domain protein n=1 Tax=Lasiosphaeria ovina TaxID=92902 RepID=A0AAE0N5L5_9PEZI|nr:ankyrin repeat-containing domain protein [Lasiosphaeria ovina]
MLLPNEGWRPLHVAASNGDSVLVNLLLKAGASVDLKDAKGRTPLHLAVMHCHLTACTVLLLRGADVNARDEDHATPLLLAKEAFDSKNFSELIKPLLNFRARVENSFGSGTTKDPLMRDSLMGYAIRQDSDVILKFLLDRGAAAVFEAEYQQTAMGVCISDSRVACLRLLISRPDYDINQMDYFGYALIHHCGAMS